MAIPYQTRQCVAPENIITLKNTVGDVPQGMVVTLNTVQDEFKMPAGDATDHILLVTLHASKLGETVSCAMGPGRVQVLANAALGTLPTKLMAGANGKAVAWAAAGGTNRAVLGAQASTCTAGDDLVEVLLAGAGTVHQG